MSTYISLDNLARYDMKAKARAEGLYADASAACWQKTEKAGAVTCVPAPETPLEPVVEFLFKETLPSGTKGPSNPSVIEGVNSIGIRSFGKNLVYPPYTSGSSISGRDASITVLSNGTLQITSSATSGNRYYGLSALQTMFKAGTKFIMSCEYGGGTVTYNSLALQLIDIERDTVLKWQYNYNQPSVYTLDHDAHIRFRLYISATHVCENLIVKPMAEIGDNATEYEKGTGADYTVNLPSTFYGGTLDVTSGKLTATHRMVEPSSGTVDISDRPALLPLEYTDTYGRTVTSDGNTLSVGSSGGQIVYRLANPYTVQIDPTPIDSLPALGKTSPRINTVYTDAESVQVGYAEHPAYTEELINNAILALGGDI